MIGVHSKQYEVVLFALVIVSALLLVETTHRCREAYTALRELELERWSLQEDYSRFLLEQSTWAAPQRVMAIAADSLRMREPALSQREVVTP